MLLKKDKSILCIIDMQEKLTPFVISHQALTDRCLWLLNLANTLDVPVLISEQYPKGLGSTIEPLKTAALSSKHCSKVHFSCMQEPGITRHLKTLEKTQLVLSGIEAHVCVLQTALEMREEGYEVFVVVDAVSSRHEIDKTCALRRMQQNGIHLISAEMVFFEWLRKAGTPEFKTLSQAFLK